MKRMKTEKFSTPEIKQAKCAYLKETKANKTGFLGVRYHAARKGFKACYSASLRVDKNKKKYLGSAPTAEEAARLYDAAVIKRFGTDAVTNFPKSDYV